MKSTNFVFRRRQHTGVLSDDMWMAHGRRERRSNGAPRPNQ